MENSSKPASKRTKSNHGGRRGRLDVSSPATATEFRAAAKAYTERATKTKAEAVKTLHRERILTKDGGFTKTYS
jgi:hypothetical protein